MKNKSKNYHLGRVISLSDAIFGFAITLMILELKLPSFANNSTLDEKWSAVFSTFPTIIGIVISFFLISIFWRRHYQLFNFVKEPDNKLVFLNIIFLFSIVFIPITTSFQYRNFWHPTNIPVVFYNLNLIITTIINFIIFKYVLEQDNQSSESASELLREIKFPVFVFSFVIILSFFVPSYITPVGYVLFAFEKLLTKRRKNKRHKKQRTHN